MLSDFRSSTEGDILGKNPFIYSTGNPTINRNLDHYTIIVNQ